MRDLSVAGKITVFKILASSKLVHLALVKTIKKNSKRTYMDNMTFSVKIVKTEVSKILTSCTK